MMEKKHTSFYQSLAESVVDLGKIYGADEIEVALVDGSEFNLDVRFGKIENLIEAGSTGIGFRIIKNKKTAFATSSDLSKTTLQYLVKKAVKRAEMANPDKCSGLPDFAGSDVDIPSLKLFDPEIPKLSTEKKINLALETERIALEDKRITNSHGANFETRVIKTILANSKGFSGEYRETFCCLSIALQAGDTDNKVEDHWYSAPRHFEDLETPDRIAKKAVERTVRQLEPKKIKTQNVPVVFEPMMTSWLLGFLFSCVSGTAIYQKTSFLTDKLGEKIGNDLISVKDDGLLPGKIGTSPFDSEGVTSRKTVVIEKGVLQNYLCNTYSGKKLALQSTGNASGTGVGPSNFYLEKGNFSKAEIISSLDKGLVLTRTLGHGLNPVTGDISRGAFGLWVENGEIVFPVSEITISGNLGKILKEIEMIGDDLEFRNSISGPTIKIGELTVAGT